MGDILNELQLQRIQGHGKHKRNLWREAQQDKEPDSRANSHLNDGEYVSVITMYAPHRCVPTGREGEEDDVSPRDLLINISGWSGGCPSARVNEASQQLWAVRQSFGFDEVGT